MVLRCPRCSELEFYGRPQVLGELVVCPRCNAAFEWQDGRGQAPEGSAGQAARGDVGWRRVKP